MDITKINGNEIIAFLNKIDYDENDNFCDCSIEQGSYQFDSQSIKGDVYTLEFTGDYNNWGTSQPIDSNKIRIKEGKIYCSFNEPFGGSGSEEIIEEALTTWLETHQFADNLTIVNSFESHLQRVKDILNNVDINSLKEIESAIEELVTAKTYIK